MHESSIAATVRDLARNVIVEGALEGLRILTGYCVAIEKIPLHLNLPQTYKEDHANHQYYCAVHAAWRRLATSAASPLARPRSI